jgi:hypothetical protein
MPKTRAPHLPLLAHLLLVTATIALLAGWAAPQAPGPPIADPPSLTPGDTWTVRFSDGAWAKRTFLRETAGLLVFEVTQGWADGTASRGLLYLTHDLATVRMLGPDGGELLRFAPHSLGLRFPLIPGQQWQDRCERFDLGKPAGTFAGVFQVVGPEDVAVPAGAFRAFRVEGRTFDPQDPAREWRFTHWYAPAARMEVRLRAVDPDGKVTEFELADFRPAGYAPPPALLAPRQAGQGPAAFLGVWEGYWREMVLATRLTVERIEGDTAAVIYWRGAYVFPGLMRPHQQHAEGRFLDERTLRVPIWDDAGQRWAETLYVLQADGTLAGQWQSGGGRAAGTLRKEP